ncbi:MAG: diguanylate cyclase, partial [Solirubrobacteraceae bacterium]
FNLSGSFTATGSTFADNQADYRGDAIYNLVYDSHTARTAQTTLQGTIVTGQGTSYDLVSNKTSYIQPSPLGTANANVSLFDLVRTMSADEQGTITGPPLSSADPMLAPLQDNGGLTETMALLPGSPALDAVPATGTVCTTSDQRGVSRPQGAACDIGAYEHAPPGVSPGDPTAVSPSGATLRGQVTANAQATSYHFDYGTTTAYGAATPAQSAGAGLGAVSVSAALSRLTPGTTYHYRLVASNADGTTTSGDRTFSTTRPGGGGAGSGGTGGGAGAGGASPRFLSASLQPRAFAVARAGRRARKAATLTYRLSEAARVVITVEHALTGRRVGHGCRAQTRTNRHQRRCTRYVRAGRLIAVAHAGLNRQGLSGRFREVAEQARLKDAPVALVMCDLDGFKALNDEHGHSCGDAVLTDVSYALRKELRSFELLYRIGGEELLLVLPGADVRAGCQVAEQVRATIERCCPGGLLVTASLGVCSALADQIRFEAMFEAADRALYEAKRLGRNRVAYVSGLDERALPWVTPAPVALRAQA